MPSFEIKKGYLSIIDLKFCHKEFAVILYKLTDVNSKFCGPNADRLKRSFWDIRIHFEVTRLLRRTFFP